MKKIIFILTLTSLLILLSGLGSVSGQGVYSYSVGLRYHYQNKTLNLEWLNLVKGSPPSPLIEPAKGYLAKVISFEGKTLYSFRFDIPTVALAPPPEWFDPETGEQIYFGSEEPVEFPSDIVFSFIVPYFFQAKAVEFYDSEDNLLLSVDLLEYQLCKDDLENCEDILIQYHQQEIEKLEGITGSEEEIQNHQSRIEELQENKSFMKRTETIPVEPAERELKEEIRWQNILIILVVIILFGFVVYFVRRRYFLKKI